MSDEKTMTTYKRADGQMIGDFGWVADREYLEDDDYYEPEEYVQETWELKNSKVIWIPDHVPCQECGDEVPLPADYKRGQLLTCEACAAEGNGEPIITRDTQV